MFHGEPLVMAMMMLLKDLRFDGEPFGFDELFPQLLQYEFLAALLLDAESAVAPAQTPLFT